MWWIKVIASAVLIINFGCGSPLENDKLHNNDIEEWKFNANVEEREDFKTKLFVPETYRLPNTSIPLSYDITLKTDIDKGIFNFSGQVKIHVRIELDNTQEIVLHYRQINITNVDIKHTNGTLIQANIVSEKISSHEFLVIPLPYEFMSTDEFIVEISYLGFLRDDSGGFYYGNYTNANGNLVFYGTTQFEINDARHAMPCYDEPGIRAPMKFTMIHDKSFSAVANMDIESQMEFEETYFKTTFKVTPSMQTYLLAFLVSDYDYVNATSTQISQKIYGIPALIASGEGDYAASIVGAVLEELESSLGVPYPNDKMDHVALNFFNFGAMVSLFFENFSNF